MSEKRSRRGSADPSTRSAGPAKGAFPPRSRLRLFVVEAQDPMDLLQRRSEAESLVAACSLIGHEVASLQVRSVEEFSAACKYIASIDRRKDQSSRHNVPLCVHIAAHGSRCGLGIGSEFVKWPRLFELLQPLCRPLPDYDGQVIIVLSACELSEHEFTTAVEDARREDGTVVPPAYLFSTIEDGLAWADGVVSWIVFYHRLPELSLGDKQAVQRLLENVRSAGTAMIQYQRWDSTKEKYLKHRPESGRLAD